MAVLATTELLAKILQAEKRIDLYQRRNRRRIIGVL
jgi:hypothetical protein